MSPTATMLMRMADLSGPGGSGAGAGAATGAGADGAVGAGAESGIASCCGVVPHAAICSIATAKINCGSLVVQQGSLDGLRATQMIQDKAQTEGNGMSFSRAATRHWIIWVAPFGRAVKRSSAVLRLLARARHYRRDAPCDQPLHNSLNSSRLPCWTTS